MAIRNGRVLYTVRTVCTPYTLYMVRTVLSTLLPNEEKPAASRVDSVPALQVPRCRAGFNQQMGRALDGGSQAMQGADFDLPDAFTGEAHRLADVGHGARVTAFEAVVVEEDVAFPLVE